ncbi:MAG: phosphatase PAP2 family protein [Actinomycetota bacterium]|nr:phosphatase PAP2 family protein [Actinomycetota bacterium]
MRAGLPEWVRKRLDPTQRYGLRVTLFAVATLLVMVPFSFLLVQVTSRGPLTETDASVADALNEVVHDSDALVFAAKFVSFLGMPAWFYVIIGAAILFFLRHQDRRLAIFLAVTNLLGGAIDTVVKIAVNRPRPEVEHPIAHALGKSFPSGHVMATTVGYGSLLLAFMPLIPRRWRIPAVAAYFVMIVLMALSRLGLGVHFVSDVIGGFVLGLAWLAAATAAFSIWRSERGKPPVELLEGAEPEVARQ